MIILITGFGLGWFGKNQHVVLLQKTVERVFQLAVVHLQNPIDHSLWSNCDRVSMRSLVVVEETNIVFHTTPLHFESLNFYKYNGMEVFLEE